MKTKTISICTLFIAAILLSACGSSAGQSTPTSLGISTSWPTSPPPSPQPAKIPFPFTERPGHVLLADNSLAGYAYRSFLQIPAGMAWGPDNMLYIADMEGRHVVRVAKDGTMDDLPFWKTRIEFGDVNALGPNDVDFDSKGNLYFSMDDSVYLVEPSGNVTRIVKAQEGPIGGIFISSTDEVYYTDRHREKGGVFKWKDGKTETVVGKLPFAQNIILGLDGTLYVTQLLKSHILKIDVSTGTVSTFVEDACGNEPCWLAVDKDGDIWARGVFRLSQFSPEGVEKPFIVDGQKYPGGAYNWSTPGGITFDKEGGLWIASYDGSLIKLVPTTTGQPDPEFTMQVISFGFNPSDLEVGPNGDIYTSKVYAKEIVRITASGTIDTLYRYDSDGNVALAVDVAGTIYAGLPNGEIVRLEADGTATHYANVVTERMAFGADGALYAVVGKQGEDKSIVRVTDVDTFTVVTTQIAGIELGKGPSHISPALDKGFYIYSSWTCDLFFMDFNGQGRLIANLKQIGCYGPALMAASPVTGDIYLIPFGGYELFHLTPDGQYTRIATRLLGDPWGMAVSPDGKWLYVAENGAVDKIPLSSNNP